MFLRLNIKVKSYSICLFFSDLFHRAYYPLGPSMWTEMERFYSFLWSNSILNSFICWWTLRQCPILAVVNSAAMNIGVHKYLWISVFLNFVFLGSNTQQRNCWIIWYFYLKFISALFFLVAILIYSATNRAQVFPFLHILANTCYLLSFW